MVRLFALTAAAVAAVAAAPAAAELRTGACHIAAQADICLHIPEDYASRLAAGATASVRVLADLTAASATVDKLRSEIQRYARTVAAQRVLARGIATGSERMLARA